MGSACATHFTYHLRFSPTVKESLAAFNDTTLRMDWHVVGQSFKVAVYTGPDHTKPSRPWAITSGIQTPPCRPRAISP